MRFYCANVLVVLRICAPQREHSCSPGSLCDLITTTVNLNGKLGYLSSAAGKFYLLQLVAVQQARPGPVITVQQAESWKEHWSKKNKTKLENVQQPQAQPHIRSAVDHEANHTSGQSPVMRTATNHVTGQHMIITWPSSIMINEVLLAKTVWGILEIRV